jgi:hypothetical protein
MSGPDPPDTTQAPVLPLSVKSLHLGVSMMDSPSSKRERLPKLSAARERSMLASALPLAPASSPCSSTPGDKQGEALGPRLSDREPRTFLDLFLQATGKKGYTRESLPETLWCNLKSVPRVSDRLSPPSVGGGP